MANINRSTRNTNAATNLADNITNDISPADVRQSIIDINDSTFSLLDDYATNTFTGVLTDAGGTATYTIGTNNCRYTRILNVVYFTIQLTTISTTGAPTGELRLSGFPVFGGIILRSAAPIFRWVGTTESFVYIVGDVSTSGYIVFRRITNSTNILTTTVGPQSFSNGAIELSGHYFVTP